MRLEKTKTNMIMPHARDAMAQRIVEAQSRLRNEIIARKERQREERTSMRVEKYHRAVQGLARNLFGLAAGGGALSFEEQVALDGFIRAAVVKKIAIQSSINIGFGILAACSWCGALYTQYPDLFGVSLLVSICLVLQNVRRCSDTECCSATYHSRHLKHCFSFLWNRRYFLRGMRKKEKGLNA